MPRTRLIFFKEDDGTVPVRDWLLSLKQRNRRAFAKCVVRIRRLAELGHELRRPEADVLRDGIHELRVREGRVHYRLLYFFHGRNVSILAHALTKENRVPASDIDHAVRRKTAFESNPDAHSHEEDFADG
ncbi:MAG: type II toxin-antitoxin system RelE/ParE family toxin [Planctomycetes bacterium]|nr:type II toxin-antitoxin system RelE/ParE family toxin [Planctomycetota bacterium]